MKIPTLLIPALLCIFLVTGSGATELTASYLYNLSDFTGSKQYTAARISIDETRNEVYVMSGEVVAIYNGSGMEIFRFDYDPSLGLVHDVAVAPNGDIFLLVLHDRKMRIVRCNFRAEPQAVVELKGMPEDIGSFSADRLFMRDGRLYLANLAEMQVVTADTDGKVISSYNLAAKAGMDEKARADFGIGGISVDREGSIYFTVPAAARVYRLGMDGEVAGFGKRGSAPGKFGVVNGIAVDKNGYLLVSDKLRCVVMVFDKDFKFVKEFGFRGFKPGNLIGPNELLVDGNNRVYVSQIRKRGVSVFQISSS